MFPGKESDEAAQTFEEVQKEKLRIKKEKLELWTRKNKEAPIELKKLQSLIAELCFKN